jgi:hypothetical protein
MKTVTLKSDNRSVLIAQDSDVVVLENNHVRRNDERIYGLLFSEVDLHENVDVPENWVSSGYFFDGITWTVNTQKIPAPPDNNV